MAITYDEIKKANESIITTDIKGKDYAEVNQRIKAFRICYPNGSIQTEIIKLQDGVVLMKAVISNEDGVVIGTGFAQEKENATFINKTSYIENCETSAVGRALGMCGFGIDTSVASYEEVANAIENQNEKEHNKETQGLTKEQLEKQYDEIRNTLLANGINISDEKVASWVKKNAKVDEVDVNLLSKEQIKAVNTAMIYLLQQKKAGAK